MYLIFALAALVALLFRLLGRYGLSAISHPAAWFSASWILGLLSYSALEMASGVLVHDEYMLQQLMAFVIASSGIFFILTFVGGGAARRHPESPVVGNIYASQYPLAYLGLLGAITNWVALGANFSYSDDLRQQWLLEIPPITARTWYLYMLSLPAAFSAGWLLVIHFSKQRKLNKFRRATCLVPLVSGVFWSLATGGRQAFGIVLLLYFAGGAICIATNKISDKKINRRFIVKTMMVSLSLFFMLSLFVGITGLARAKQQGNTASSFDHIPMLSSVGQFIEYLGQPVAVHQAYGTPRRRNLKETGPVTLAGFQKFGIRYLTGWRPVRMEDTNPERRLAYTGLAYASGTRNIFYDFQSDFGLFGAFIAVLILSIVAHALYLMRPMKGGLLFVTKHVPLVMFLLFWGYSLQFSLLMHDTMFWITISAVSWDIFAALVRGLNRRLN